MTSPQQVSRASASARPEVVGARPPIAVGVSYEGRPATLLTHVAALVDCVEIIPDAFVHGGADRPHAGVLAELDQLLGPAEVTFHGVGLSLGTASGWNEDWLRLVEQVLQWRTPRFVSEHLGYTTVDGHFLGTMPALPCTPEAAALVIGRARRLRRELGVDVLLEHVASPLPRSRGMGLGPWLDVVARESGCGVLLDVHNLECDVDNGWLDLDEFLGTFDLALVREIHVAGGVWHDGIHFDVHSRRCAPSTWDLLATLIPRCARLELVVAELLAAAVPSVTPEGVAAELTQLRNVIEEAGRVVAA
jgi:uncharacterized protein (UPF0276 family)